MNIVDFKHSVEQYVYHYNDVFSSLVDTIASYVSGKALIIYVAAAAIIATVALGFIQFRYLFSGLKEVLFPPKTTVVSQGPADMTPLQAFINTLGASIGNGSLAGMGVALALGGPGAGFWVVVTGITMMSLRFMEVYLSVHYKALAVSSKLGGPMLYLSKVLGGKTLVYIYTIATLFFGFAGGCLIQTNSISRGLKSTFANAHIDMDPRLFVAVACFALILYVALGGAARVAAVADRLVPIKVIAFFTTALAVIAYNYAGILPALKLMVVAAFTPQAVMGAVAGVAIQQALLKGMTHSIFASESGLGTAAILFGTTGSVQPVKDGLLAMIGAFISTVVCFLVLLCILSARVLQPGLDGIELTIAAYQTLFGQWAGWIVSFLSVTFGLGVIVAYVYISREVWLTLTKGRYSTLFAFKYAAVGALGALATVKIVWGMADIVNAIMLFVNIFGLMYLLPVVRDGLKKYERTTSH